MTCDYKRAEIVKGSKNEFTLELVDDCDKPISLTGYVSGTLKFTNCDGVETTVNLTVPGANPDKGLIQVTVLSAASADTDENWKDAVLTLIDGSAEPKIFVLKDQFEIILP